MTPEQIGRLYESTHPTLTAYFASRLAPSHRHLAEDFASDVFVKALRACETYRDRGLPVMSWLYAIARNLLIDHSRRARKLEFSSLSMAREHPRDRAAERAIDAVSDTDEVARLLAALTPEQRDVIRLHYGYGYREPDMVAILGRSVVSVKKRKKRALATMRRLLEVA